LSSERRKQIYNVIRMRFIERAKAETGDAKNWKKTRIDNMTFEEYYNEALSSLEFRIDNDLSDEKDREMWLMWHGEPLSKLEQEKLAEEKAKREGEKTEYVLSPEVLRLWNAKSEQERFDEMKETERQINEELAAARIPTCPVCKCNPCICRN
jgi:hypothetical protein